MSKLKLCSKCGLRFEESKLSEVHILRNSTGFHGQMKMCNRCEDILTQPFMVGKSEEAVLAYEAGRKQGRAEGGIPLLRYLKNMRRVRPTWLSLDVLLYGGIIYGFIRMIVEICRGHGLHALFSMIFTTLIGIAAIELYERKTKTKRRT